MTKFVSITDLEPKTGLELAMRLDRPGGVGMSKRVCITGGAGSLGKAFVRLLHTDYDVTVVDNNEWAIAEMRPEFPDVTFILGDFAAPNDEYYDYHIHLAAYKHIDLGETNPLPFIENNINKTIKYYQDIEANSVKILYVSTDKAVEPISLYGMTKAIAEKLTHHYGGSVARLGNILNSKGSVIPVWEAAIEKGEPIKITDERMARYVIEDNEAAGFVWSRFLAGDKLIVPTQMKEVRIMDILSDVLKRHGYEKASDYPAGVEVIGMRPGERLREKLLWDFEEVSKEQL
jgi:UDP-N-acetylglucosamine 4,6-dehydratase